MVLNHWFSLGRCRPASSWCYSQGDVGGGLGDFFEPVSVFEEANWRSVSVINYSLQFLSPQTAKSRGVRQDASRKPQSVAMPLHAAYHTTTVIK